MNIGMVQEQIKTFKKLINEINFSFHQRCHLKIYISVKVNLDLKVNLNLKVILNLRVHFEFESKIEFIL